MAGKNKRQKVSENAKHNALRVFLYGGILFIVVYFFNDLVDSTKKMTYISNAQFEPKNIKKAVILEGDKNLLVETDSGMVFVVVDFDKAILEKNNISYSHENNTLKQGVRYALSALLLIFVLLLSIT